MRALILGLALATLTYGAVAGEAVQLDGRKLAGQTATGTCGNASIKVSGIDLGFNRSTQQFFDIALPVFRSPASCVAVR